MIRNMPTQFNQPYDSPIEEILAWTLSKHIAGDVELIKQHLVETTNGNFRLDFVVKRPNAKLIAIECDGKEFHVDVCRDQLRDSLILINGAVETIYRFRGQDLHYHTNDCLYWLTKTEPSMFSERGSSNLYQLATDEARRRLGDVSGRTKGSVVIFYRDEDARKEFDVWLSRRSRKTDIELLTRCAKFCDDKKKMPFESLLKLYRNLA